MRNEKILVVEFEENSLNLLLQTLQDEGFQVVTAKDGHEGLLMFESENPDLVILEPMLLKLHGFDLCRKISKDSDKKTPVIITTGFYKGEHYKSEAIETFGASAFFEKPYKNEELMTTIQELLANGTAESVKEIKKSSKEKKAPSIDFEESVKEMERSIKEQEAALTEQAKQTDDSAGKTKKSGISTQVDEMLQDALSDFGLNIDNKPQKKKAEKEPKQKPQQKASVEEQEPPVVEKTMEKEEVQVEEPQEEDKELKTEELIEELIQKEEQTEDEEKPEEEEIPEVQVVQKEQEKVEDLGEKIQEEVEQEVEQEVKHEVEQEVEHEEADQKIFEDYFEEPEKAPVRRSPFRFLQKIKNSLPLMIGSTAFVVLVAAGATYLFLKPNKPKTLSNQKMSETISNVERSTPPLAQQEYTSPTTQDENAQSELSGGPTLEGAEGNQVENATSSDDIVASEDEPESTTEFMSTTGLSSRQRQVMLPEGAPSTESRQFEIIEVEETNEEQLGQSEVEISSPQLTEAVKNIIQSENTSDRIKVGDLVPIETVDVLPVATKKVNPKYPPAAFQRGIEQTVVFRALISEFGNVLDVAFVDPSKTAPAFRNACDEAVRQWRFSPAKKNGVNVKVWKTFSIAFKKNTTE